MAIKTVGKFQNLNRALAEGRYHDVLERTATRKNWRPVLVDLPAVLGAFCFLGRMEQAEALYLEHESKLVAREDLAMPAWFFVAMGHCRLSNYQRSREFIGQALRALRKWRCPQSIFFAYQALAFYRYFCGQYARAFSLGGLAQRAALEARFVFGSVLSAAGVLGF